MEAYQNMCWKQMKSADKTLSLQGRANIGLYLDRIIKI